MTDFENLDDRTLLQRAAVQVDGALTSPEPTPRAEAAHEALTEWLDRRGGSDGKWTCLTDENTNRVSHEPWRIECPDCGQTMVSAYGATETATKDCVACGATIEFAVRAADD